MEAIKAFPSFNFCSEGAAAAAAASLALLSIGVEMLGQSMQPLARLLQSDSLALLR